MQRTETNPYKAAYFLFSGAELTESSCSAGVVSFVLEAEKASVFRRPLKNLESSNYIKCLKKILSERDQKLSNFFHCEVSGGVSWK